MSTRLVVGLDGHSSGERALAHASKMANRIGDCEILVVYVVEWSPFSFQTAEENEQRHKRREEEIKIAHERVIDPAVAQLKSEGFSARGIVKHGNVADCLDEIANAEKADQIVVARSAEAGIGSRIFGSSTSKLVMHARVPVTVVG